MDGRGLRTALGTAAQILSLVGEVSARRDDGEGRSRIGSTSPSGRFATTSPTRGRISGSPYFNRVHFCVLHSGKMMQPFSFSSLSLSSSSVPE